jgi:hypothetical protein
VTGLVCSDEAPTLELLLKRRWLSPTTTIGELSIDGVFQCFILEDHYRPPGEAKIFGETAIPCGRYEIQITNSKRFSELAGKPVDLPLLIGVPNYSGVRIHTGNKAIDTKGCLLPGRVRGVDEVRESRPAFVDLFSKLAGAPGRIWITITL